MRQPMFLAVAGAIVLAVAGCSSEPDATAPSPSPSVSAAPTGQKPAAQPFTTASKPLVAQQKPPAPGAVPGLIQSTNPDERAKQVQASINSDKAKKDPFAGLPPAIPRTPIVPNRTQVPTVSQLPQNSRPNRTTGSPLSAPRPPKPSSPFPPISPSASASTPKRSPGANPAGPSIATLPPLPTADLANAVQVTGVVKVGGEVQAIVKAPNEETSRYVRVGQRLSNGQILVKRIDLSGADPVVVLEENGVEVGRAVGEPAVQPQKGANQPAA